MLRLFLIVPASASLLIRMAFQEPATLSSSNPPSLSPQTDAAPALTILWHPDFSRIGAMFSFADIAEGQSLFLSRLSPKFTFHTQIPGSLADPYLSRNPSLQFIRTTGGLDLVPVDSESKVQLDGKPLSARISLSATDFLRSPILTLARRIVLCLHKAIPASRSLEADDLGLLGGSDAMEAVRQSILSAADIDLPVLVQGETGTGKELTATAIAKASRRAGKPFVAINTGALPPTTALAELFGHVRGAFTGATESREGYFVEADGGILFLDEIGLATAEVQTALLRVLETGEVRALGSRSARRVNVRVIAATDVRLQERVAAGDFSQPLFHRLSAFPIGLPPLRERRQDIGSLFLHFLRQTLKETGDLARLEIPPDAKHPWLSGDAMTRVALALWPGNIRQLRNFAAQIVLTNRGASEARLDSTLLSSLAHEAPIRQPIVAKTKPRVKPTDVTTISHERLADALERHGFRPTRAARDLGISRTTLYELIRRDPELRKASDIPDNELGRLEQECQGDLTQLSERLHISVRALQLRLHRNP
jgi:two-component system, NtrC family, nitrogen regulation response regulator GlnG